MHRYCGYCQQKEVLGDETHILLVCPTTENLRDELILQLERKLRRGAALTLVRLE